MGGSLPAPGRVTTVVAFALGCAGSGSTEGALATGDAGGAADTAAVAFDAATARGGDEDAPNPGTLLLVDATARDADTHGCANAASAFAYVLSNANDLYSFAPDKKVLTKIGALGCNATGQPNSMAVDRNATAWVNYLSGTIYPVNTKDASCQGPPIVLPTGWSQVGMGFSSESAGATAETLYVTGAYASASAGFARVDLSTRTLVPIGQFTGTLMGQSAELTGTGDGRLFGFFTGSPVQLAEIDKASAAIKSVTPLAQIGVPRDFAFSFWGGRFYFYTFPNPTGSSTSVTQYDPTTGVVDTSYMPNIGFIVVGAGVSTCAPVHPPGAQ